MGEETLDENLAFVLAAFCEGERGRGFDARGTQIDTHCADVVGRKVASAKDVDSAMRLGVGYPIGPLEWGDRIGVARVVVLLDALARMYGDGRYRACPTLRRAAWSRGCLREL